MKYALTEPSIKGALGHLCRFGDTDMFPNLPELSFYHDKQDEIVAELAALDLNNHRPDEAIEALSPKGHLNFRIAHQLGPLDSILVLACIWELAPAIQARRDDVSESRAFSYRVAMSNHGVLFQDNRSFRDWLISHRDRVLSDPNIKKIVETDISDFYARINFHRLENLLDEVAPKNGAAKYLKRAIKRIRVRQSFGLPVGSSASRLLAELALVDVDIALKDEEIAATRYVDDFRLFLTDGDDPLESLGFLSQVLITNEGLCLNASKTKVHDRDEFLVLLEGLTADPAESTGDEELDQLISHLYFEDIPDPNEIAELIDRNVLNSFREEFEREKPDFQKVRTLFRGLRLVRSQECVPYVVENFDRMAFYAKDAVLLMCVLHEDNPDCFKGLTNTVIRTLHDSPASKVQLLKTWLMELFVRGVVSLKPSQIKRLESASTLLDRRQLHIIRGQSGLKNFFRQQKSSFDQMPLIEQYAFLIGATCLPSDEYRHWLSELKPGFTRPLGKLYLNWLVENQTSILGELDRKVFQRDLSHLDP